LLSVRFAGAAGSQRKSLRALWLIVGSKLTDNGSWFMPVQPLDKTNEPHGLAKLGGVSGETKTFKLKPI
jgi:hypothetical protein